MKRKQYCSKCKENSAVIKIYSRKATPTIMRRVEYCENKGCGYRQELPELNHVNKAAMMMGR